MIHLHSEPETAPGIERFLAIAALLTAAGVAFAMFRPVRPVFLVLFAMVGLVRVVSLALRPSPAEAPAGPQPAEKPSSPEKPSSAPQESEPQSQEDILRWALERAMLLSGGTTGSIMLLDPGTGMLRIAAAQGLPEEIVSSANVRPGEGVAGMVMDSRRPMIVEDSPLRTSPPRHEGVRSAVSVPISNEHLVVGVLNVGHPHNPSRITDEQVQELRMLGSRIASALGEGDPTIRRIMDSL